MGEVIQFIPRAPEEPGERAPSRLPDGGAVDSPVIVLATWSRDLVRRVFASLRLTYWYLHGGKAVMDFLCEPWAARYLRHPAADANLWARMHAIWFPHFCLNLPLSLRAPIEVKRLLGSRVLESGEVRIYFEMYLCFGSGSGGEPLAQECYGVINRENFEQFECRFMLEVEG